MLDENTQAILLLSSRFGRGAVGDPDPLTPTEYGRLDAWLREQERQPSDLLRHFDATVSEWSDPKAKITLPRLKALLGRGMAMGIALEKWNSAGIWILTRAQSSYPGRLRARLGNNAPALLLGVGNAGLLEVGGVAIVGSRYVDAEEQEFTRAVAEAAAGEGYNVVSGGARGVDEIAMRAALEAKGTAVGVLANDLLKAALSSSWRPALKSGQLCLVTSYYPEAPFQVGNAMGRNKYVYCLSDYAVVVRADEGRGGTWAGAKENLANGWIPLFVRAQSQVEGVTALVAKGAVEFRVLVADTSREQEWLRPQLEAGAPSEERSNDGEVEADLYSQVLIQAHAILRENSRVKLVDLKKVFPQASQNELIECLDQAVEEGVLERRGQKRSYAKYAPADAQEGLFDDAS